ncbi:hypothetical protein MHBO_002938 [Bonamia ostreae]|uniref:LAGLIDADG homing endonuclease n=1 Tax=Bonamia ostreae TaxID=126728 RepID=A0ABV2AP10_9EUKA
MTVYLTKTILGGFGLTLTAQKIKNTNKNYMMSKVESHDPILVSTETRNSIEKFLNYIRNGSLIMTYVRFLRDTKDFVIKSKYFIPFVSFAAVIFVFTVISITVQLVRSK